MLYLEGTEIMKLISRDENSHYRMRGQSFIMTDGSKFSLIRLSVFKPGDINFNVFL